MTAHDLLLIKNTLTAITYLGQQAITSDEKGVWREKGKGKEMEN